MRHPVAVLALALTALTAAAAPASANTDRHVELIAYGEGITRCAVDIQRFNGITRPDSIPMGHHKTIGTTRCTTALQQSARLWQPLSTGYTLDGVLCSGVRDHCISQFGGRGSPTGLVYYAVTLVAPAGQGWIAAPSHCAGGGTDRLSCTFAVEMTTAG